ncbi:hypothetical protein [Bacillus sp. ISL-39]|uniref:hypothetical protein n=1 Tax=Bacillus sp. ISL-39 TaxID=2819124 RepID=UPI001BE51561|nr:hypothetical protein [Bacillus sp. ISL-39]MBT2636703.1 hypothetical protein [Bacillus sp. ISL-39]
MQARIDDASSPFIELLYGLDTGLIILIDDDFIFKPDNFEGIISDLVCLRDCDIESIINKFRKEELVDLADEILGFKEAFVKLPVLEEHYPLLNTAKRIILYLDKFNSRIAEEVKSKAESLINFFKVKLEKESAIEEIFMRYGVGLSRIKNYRELLTLVRNHSVRLYKQKPDMQLIQEDMAESITGSQFCIFIVDKLLGDEDGVRFVKDELIPYYKDKNVISIIYTSEPKITEPQRMKDYFVLEIDKKDSDALKQLTDGLALCTYVELFNRLGKIHINSIEKAQELALSRKDNMIYLASMAHEEGLTAYEAISNWFNLASQYNLASSMMTGDSKSEYNFLLGLTNFLQEDYLGSNAGVEIEKEATIQELNTFEIFDYGINIQCQPPAPGDVFKMPDGKYAILVGQDCDLVIRGSNVKRKAKHADLVRADFIPTHNIEKVMKDAKSLEFNYFCPNRAQSSSHGVLKVNFENPLTSDFLVLDTCSFNENGEANINLGLEIDSNVKKVIPLSWSKYYDKIQSQLEQYLNIYKFCNETSADMEILSANDISVYKFNQDGSNINFNIQRVCRIKREFRDILLNTYWEYRRRTGVNTIGLVEREKIPHLNIKIGYPGQDYKLLNDIDLDAYIRKSNKRKHNADFKKIPLYFKTDILIDKLREFSDFKGIEEETIEIEKRSHTHPRTSIIFEKEIEEDKISSIIITLPYRIGERGLIAQGEKFSIKSLLNKELQETMKENKENLFFLLEGNKEKHPIFDPAKNEYRKVEVKELLIGLVIPGLKVKIKINNGTISVLEDLHAIEY